ncbi:MAG: AraC family transcriptional regulator [Ruminococcaceae bacterium]|nr:AraC family transcriptional regulator [Oscillospiraceae bacterium]
MDGEKYVYSVSHAVDTPLPERFHRHMHNEYEILYFLDGDAEYIIEGSVYKLKPGDLIFIRPKAFHYLLPISEKTYDRIVMHFSLSSIPLELHSFVNEAKEIYRIPKGHMIERLFENLLYIEGILSTKERRIFQKGYVEQILLSLKHLTTYDSVQPIRETKTLDKILRYIEEHPHEKIDVKSLSSTFYVSTSWIVHTFKKTLGISLMQYVNKKRILYAETMIRSGMSPTEVAKACNFDSYTTFYRQYTKVLGHSPKIDSTGA